MEKPKTHTLAELESIDGTILIDTHDWSWVKLLDGPQFKPTKMRTSPDRSTEWLTSDEAVTALKNLANRGFVSKCVDSISFKLQMLAVVPTPKGILICSPDGESFPIVGGADLLDFDEESRYYDMHPLTGACTDVWKKPMEPTKRAARERRANAAIRLLEKHGVGIYKHGVTMEEMWRIEKVCTPDVIRAARKKGAAHMQRLLREKADRNVAAKREPWFDFHRTQSATSDGMTSVFHLSPGSLTTIAAGTIVRINEGLLLRVRGEKDDGIRTSVILQHFLDRYMEREGFDKEDEDIAIERLAEELFFSAPSVDYGKAHNRACTFTALRDGAGLGATIDSEGRSVEVLKTFVPTSMLAKQQLEAYTEFRRLIAEGNF